jgi:hypothetical protein
MKKVLFLVLTILLYWQVNTMAVPAPSSFSVIERAYNTIVIQFSPSPYDNPDVYETRVEMWRDDIYITTSFTGPINYIRWDNLLTGTTYRFKFTNLDAYENESATVEYYASTLNNITNPSVLYLTPTQTSVSLQTSTNDGSVTGTRVFLYNSTGEELLNDFHGEEYYNDFDIYYLYPDTMYLLKIQNYKNDLNNVGDEVSYAFKTLAVSEYDLSDISIIRPEYPGKVTVTLNNVPTSEGFTIAYAYQTFFYEPGLGNVYSEWESGNTLDEYALPPTKSFRFRAQLKYKSPRLSYSELYGIYNYWIIETPWLSPEKRRPDNFTGFDYMQPDVEINYNAYGEVVPVTAELWNQFTQRINAFIDYKVSNAPKLYINYTPRCSLANAYNTVVVSLRVLTGDVTIPTVTKDVTEVTANHFLSLQSYINNIS